MTKKLFKLNKKLGQGLATLIKVEKKPLDQIITKLETTSFIIVHFGDGREEDYLKIKEFLDQKITLNYELDLYPAYPHGYIRF
jgi:hypothetical protein